MFKKLAVLGLDIGTHSIKTAVVNPDNKKIEYLDECKILEGRKFLEDAATDEALKDLVKMTVEKAKSSNSKYDLALAGSVHGPGIICRYMDMPKLSDKELALAVPSAAHKLIPFSLNDIVLNYVKIPPLNHSKDTTGILFFAIHKDQVETHKFLIKNCGMKEERLEIPALALARELMANNSLPSDRFYAIVNIGFKYTHVIVVRNGFPYYARDFAIASGDFTHAFQMWKQNSWNEAEQEKLNYDVMLKEIALEPFLSNWETEIRKALKFFVTQFNNSNILLEKIFLTGGSSVFGGLSSRLESFISLPVETDSLKKLKPDKNIEISNINKYKSAIGLSL
ncbi:MAG: pilus assembly protein PilM [Firmicutes bacterium]|nr:pilus assembly protein PilM [Bacillota bacterium]